MYFFLTHRCIIPNVFMRAFSALFLRKADSYLEKGNTTGRPNPPGMRVRVGVAFWLPAKKPVPVARVSAGTRITPNLRMLPPGTAE